MGWRRRRGKSLHFERPPVIGGCHGADRGGATDDCGVVHRGHLVLGAREASVASTEQLAVAATLAATTVLMELLAVQAAASVVKQIGEGRMEERVPKACTVDEV